MQQPQSQANYQRLIGDEQIKNDNIILPLMSKSNCRSKNCIYIIICIKCKFYYIGQTINIYKRMLAHLNNIKNYEKNKGKIKFEVANHFNKKAHNLKTDLKFCVFKNDIVTLEERLFIENDLINIFIKAKLNIINDYIPQHFKCKTLCFN